MTGGRRKQQNSASGFPRRRANVQVSYNSNDDYEELEYPKAISKGIDRSRHHNSGGRRSAGSRRSKVAPEGRVMADGRNGAGHREKNTLHVDVSSPPDPPESALSSNNLRGSSDLRSPGVPKTPAANAKPKVAVVPDFITQTDKHGHATTPRSESAIQGARRSHPSGPKPHLHVTKDGKLTEKDNDDVKNENDGEHDACDSILDSLRMMCCCLLSDTQYFASGKHTLKTGDTQDTLDHPEAGLLGDIHPDDKGKKCLVLDLDETLVHSSFRPVPGADFVIPVQIEDVVHFVYVMKRPGVDEFLVEMAKHYEIVIYTASLNKYADPLLDLLDPNKVIRARLFRESCVYYEGNYVKDLSLLDRDLSQSIIIDNSPASYMFHPENAIDCSSFIDDPNDRELDQIGAFLAGIKDVEDVRGITMKWRDYKHR